MCGVQSTRTTGAWIVNSLQRLLSLLFPSWEKEKFPPHHRHKFVIIIIIMKIVTKSWRVMSGTPISSAFFFRAVNKHEMHDLRLLMMRTACIRCSTSCDPRRCRCSSVCHQRKHVGAVEFNSMLFQREAWIIGCLKELDSNICFSASHATRELEIKQQHFLSTKLFPFALECSY